MLKLIKWLCGAAVVLSTILMFVPVMATVSQEGGGPTGMVVTSLAIHGTTVYAGTESNWVYKSLDGGASWRALDSGVGATYVSSLAIDPTDSRTIYAGTGGFCVLKSADGGDSWTAIYDGFPINYGVVMVNALAIDPRNSQTIYAGIDPMDGFGLYKSNNGGDLWNNLNLSGRVTALGIDPVFSEVIYAGAEFGEVFKTTNGGASWSAVKSGFPDSSVLVNTISIDPTDHNTIYVGLNNGCGVYKSTNGGGSWQAISGLPLVGSVNALAIEPSSGLTLYAGTSNGLFRSTNGGDSWNEVTTFSNSNVTSLALDAQTLYVGTGDGVYRVIAASGTGGTPVPIMEGWWLVAGIVAGVGMLAKQRRN